MSDSASRRWPLVLAIAVSAAGFAPALIVRAQALTLSPVIDSIVFGMAILSAGFLLSWAAEAAESYVSQGLVLAVVAIVTVLPEYAVDIYYAYRAGSEPAKGYVAFAAANMTGANRLLIGLAWPALTLLNWWKTRKSEVQLQNANRIEIGILGAASLYAFVIVWKKTITLFDTVALASLFCVYLWLVIRLPKSQDDDDDDDEVGLNAVIAALPRGQRLGLMLGLAVVSAAVIVTVAGPFAESMLRLGTELQIDQFLLIQWLAPLVSEAPEFVIAALFVLAGRAGAALIAVIADKINQWTLLVGMLPLAMTLGAGSLMSFDLDARQHEEFFLTAAQSLFGLGLLLRLRLTVLGALLLAALFFGQIGVAFLVRQNEAQHIAALTIIAWLYLALAVLVFAWNWRRLRKT